MKKPKAKSPSPIRHHGDELKSFFEELVPDYDEERVYVSDIKKVFQWYNQLHSHELLEVVEKEEEDSDQKIRKKESAAERRICCKGQRQTNLRERKAESK